MGGSVTWLTVTYRQDIERFKLLRRSMAATGTDDCPHIVVVHSEDVRLALQVRDRRNMTVVPTAAVLPRALEQRRRAGTVGRSSWRHWVPTGPLAGWMAQQVVKIGAHERLGLDVIVHVDSDLVLLRHISSSAFVTSSGTPRLFTSSEGRTRDTDAWNIHSARVLGLDIRPEIVQRQWIHQPTVTSLGVVNDLVRHLEQRSGMAWPKAFVEANLFEFPTYGVFAATQSSVLLAPSAPLGGLHVFEYPGLFTLKDDLAAAIERPEILLASVQSRLAIPPDAYRNLIEPAWR